jgi:hypothetical protein
MTRRNGFFARRGILGLFLVSLWVSAQGVLATNSPIFSATIGVADQTVLKGIAVRIGEKKDATVCFDTELVRVAGGWVGGFASPIKLMSRGEYPTNMGTLQFMTAPRPGWGKGVEIKDPRPKPYGPLPANWCKYRGVYLSDDWVVFSYTVGGTGVLESPDFDATERVFSRTFKIEPSAAPMLLAVCAAPKNPGKRQILERVGNGSFGYICLDGDPDAVAAGVRGAPKEAVWEIMDGQLYLKLPPLPQPAMFRVWIWKGDKDEGLTRFAEQIGREGAYPDPSILCQGSTPHWPQTIETRGEPGQGVDAYTVDTLTLPFKNPYNSEMLLAGLDFFPDGKRAAVCTFQGDVWVVSGIDAGLQKLVWKRFAAGLFHALGLKIVDNLIYVTGRDQITRLHDLNQDGEADFYENFNNDCQITKNFHEFALDLQTDAEGNFYFAKAGPVRNGGRGFEEIVDHHGSLFRISKDGRRFEVIATGFRAPNGIGVGPDGQLTSGDNEGSWMPKCRLNWIRPGGFEGVIPLAHRNPPPTTYDSPICWLPKEVDNSSGGQVWVPDAEWGPFGGRMLHLSYGTCSLFLVLMEQDQGRPQGGVVRFPLNFGSGIMRARFNPTDHALYVCGMKGWQTSAAQNGCLQRIRHTGKPVRMPTALNVNQRGVRLTFTTALNPASASDLENYSVTQWNYIWSDAYGSPDISSASPPPKPEEDGKEWSQAQSLLKQHDTVVIKSAALAADGKSVFLEIPGIKPVMQMRIQYNLTSADGVALKQEIYNTINWLGTAR